jgi:hypothetical protein
MLRTSFTFVSSRGQSCSPASFFGSGRMWSPSTMRLRYSTCRCSKTHLEGFRKYDSTSRRSRTSWTMRQCL